jgi:hypothetical protein
MTTQEARDYFKSSGLTYKNITKGKINYLMMLLEKRLLEYKGNIINYRLNHHFVFVSDHEGMMEKCFLFVKSDKFKERECISFNGDGFIGFAGWASSDNTEPILKAFIEWCDKFKVMKCDLCGEYVQPLDAHVGYVNEGLCCCHIDCWNIYIDEERKNR